MTEVKQQQKKEAAGVKLYLKDRMTSALQSSGSSFVLDGIYVHGGVSREVKVKMKKREKLSEVDHEYKVMNILFDKNHSCFIRPYELLKGWEGHISSDFNDNLSDYCGIVMERGIESLSDFLARELNDMSRIGILALIEKLINILIAAHKAEIVLMDFKPSNIIGCLNEHNSMIWKAIDFDDSKGIGKAVNLNCTAQYTSFEMAKYILNKDSSCKTLLASKAMDICSLGWMVWKMMNGNKSLWQEKGLQDDDDAAILQLLSTMTDEDMKKNISFAFPGELNASLRRWLADALKADPSNRPAAETLKKNYSILGYKEGTKDMDSFIKHVDSHYLRLFDRIDTLSQDLMDKFGHLEASLDQEVIQLALNSQIDAVNHLIQTLEEQRENAQGNNLQEDQFMLQLKETGADIKESVIASIAQILLSKNDLNATQSDKLDSILQMMHEMKEQMNEITILNQRQLSLLGQLGLKNNFMPHLFCIIPEMNRQLLDKKASSIVKTKNWAMRTAESMQRCVWSKSRLIFICPVTLAMVPCGLDDKGYVINLPLEWVQNAAPILKIGWLLLKVALATQGLGNVIPNIDIFLPATFSKDVLNGVLGLTAATAEDLSTRDLMEDITTSSSALEYLFKLMARAEGCNIESNAALMTSWKPAKTGLHLTLCKKTGESAWVSSAGIVAYKKQGNASFEEVVSGV